MKRLTLFVLTCLCISLSAIAQQWIPITQEAKPYTRWWWLGSAVDSVGLEYNLTELAKAGIGGVEITPIYGVQGNDKNEIPYLSPRWMRMLKYVVDKGNELGIETNMATGTGWPFGGPLVSREDAAKKLVFNDNDALRYDDKKSNKNDNNNKNDNDNEGKKGNGIFSVGLTSQKVKRAAPGGEGLVIDHFDKTAVANYLQRFDTAFVNQQVPFPHTFFNDSYEVYGADWTANLLEEFKARRGYDLEPFVYILNKKDDSRTDADKRIISDYRETLAELLLENFTSQWTDWAHKHGSITRNQAHGSPANLLDIYAAVDIPECEGFGLSNFGIRGLRQDTAYTKKNFSDISMLKYASSGAHISGKKYTSSETFTWLTEHFRTSLSQCKPDLDLMFLSGVNHIFFHGSCYSPKDAEWPGWRFYASVDMSPNNNWWSAMPAFSKYIERCQSFLQWGDPDNDVLVYLPFYDMIYDQPGTVALFDIHSMEKRAPKFINTVQSIINDGYDVDYVSDKFLQGASVKDGMIHLADSKTAYATIVVPDVQFMPVATLRRLLDLVNQGGQVMFVRALPTSVPGYGKNKEQKEFISLIKQIQHKVSFLDNQSMMTSFGNAGGSFISSHDFSSGLEYTKARRENMRNMQGLSCIRRVNEDGYHYFISNLQGKDVNTFIELGVRAASVFFYNPMNGNVTKAEQNDQGLVKVQLKSGESIIVRTFNTQGSEPATLAAVPKHIYYDALEYRATKLSNWTLSFKEAAPVAIDKTWTMTEPKSWTELGDSILNETMAIGVYTNKINMAKIHSNAAFILDLGDVRETAHVFINDKDAGMLFAVPYRVDITPYLHEGENTIKVEVANLPANRIAKLDRDGVQWRKFKEINVVDLNYKKTLYDAWTPVPSGLCSEVKIVPCTKE